MFSVRLEKPQPAGSSSTMNDPFRAASARAGQAPVWSWGRYRGELPETKSLRWGHAVGSYCSTLGEDLYGSN
jgi:hypothetical protein